MTTVPSSQNFSHTRQIVLYLDCICKQTRCGVFLLYIHQCCCKGNKSATVDVPADLTPDYCITMLFSFCRGKCSVIQLTDVQSVRRFVPDPDTFFTLLGYNPDTRRLATIQGEIRIGFSHQVSLSSASLAK